MRLALLDNYYNSNEYKVKLLQRVSVLQECEGENLKITQYALEQWSVNPIIFIEQFGWIINPKYHNEVKPFFLFDYQKRIIERIWQAEVDGKEIEILIDKPREMGLTWVLIWYQIWRWLFSKNWSGFNLSRSEAEVDDGTADPSSSLFGKFRWGLNKLPSWLTPEGFNPKGKKGTSTDSALRISNPQMQSTLVGSTTNSNAGRSRRYSFAFIDECFFIEHFMEVRRAMTSTANVRIYVSTSAVGKSFKDFRDLCEQQGNYISLKYEDNPFKDKEWYDQKVMEAQIDPEAMKEVEVSYQIPLASQYYPEINQARCAKVEYDRHRPLFGFLDYGRQDHTVLGFTQFDGRELKILECVAKNKVDFEWFYPFMDKSLIYDPLKYFGNYAKMLERIRTWEKPLVYFGEPAHKQVHYPSNTSIQQELARHHIRLMINDNASSHEVRRKAASLLLPKTVFNSDSDGCMELYDAIAASRYAGSNKGTSKESIMKPAHDDEIGDYRSAFENLCCNITRILRTQRTEIHSDLKQSNFFQAINRFLKI